MAERNTWWDNAGCRDVDPAVFCATSGGGWGYNNYEFARKLCAECPVRTACLEDALSQPPTWESEGGDGQTVIATGFSMFQAGLTPAELSRLYRARQ